MIPGTFPPSQCLEKHQDYQRRRSCLFTVRCQHVPNRELVLPLFWSLSLSMQWLLRTRSVLETYRFEMVAWQKEMGNATGATRCTGLRKLATDDASPPQSPFIQ